MEDYDDSDGGQAFLDYEEWAAACDVQDAPYLPTPEELGRCHSGLHQHDAGCLCRADWADDTVPF